MMAAVRTFVRELPFFHHTTDGRVHSATEGDCAPTDRLMSGTVRGYLTLYVEGQPVVAPTPKAEHLSGLRCQEDEKVPSRGAGA